MIKGFIFDLDGTLLNTLPAITAYLNDTLDCMNRRHVTEDDVKIFVGDGAKKLVERTLTATGTWDEEEFEFAFRHYNELYNATPLAMTAPYDGVVELLKTLKTRGFAVGILSNKPEEATLPILEVFFEGLYTTAHGGRPGVPLKPNPAGGLLMLEEMGISPKETVYVGDTGTDMQTGKGLGAVVTVGVLWGFRTEKELIENNADVIVKTPSEILNVVEKINNK